MTLPKSEPDIYIYKVVADIGGAPCVTADLLSLAICKPKIRRSADVGSLIFGFGGKRYGERLIYVARITEKPEAGDYYRQRPFAKRPDCIYRDVHGLAKRKLTARYHRDPANIESNVGRHFENAFVLLSHDFRYFGRTGTDEYKHRYPRIRDMVEGLKRGHRRYHSPRLREELVALKKDVWKAHRRLMIGLPSERNPELRCNGNSPTASC